jgi:hypothetical protein
MSKSFLTVVFVFLMASVFFIGTVPVAVAQEDCPLLMKKIRIDETVTGRISGNNPVAQYCFEGRAGEQVTIDLERDTGSLDAFLEITTISGDEIFITNDDRSLSSTDAQIVFVLPETAVYVINATRFDREDGTTQGTFKLTMVSNLASEADPDSSSDRDEDEAERPDGCPALYDTIAYSEPFDDKVDDDNVFHYFCFVGEKGQEVVIDAVADDSELDTYLILTDLRIEDVLAENDDVRLGNRDSRIIYVLPESGAYLITVSRYDFEEGTTEGDFTLTLRLNDGTLPEEDLLDIQEPNPYDCNRPLLQQLNATQWLEENTDYNFRLNFGCEGLVAVTIFGDIFTAPYEFTDNGLQLTLDNRVYTIDLQPNGSLKLTSDANQEFVFSDVGDCSDSIQQDLIEGVWFLEENTTFFRLDFMCNEVVILTLDSTTDVYTYEFDTNTDVLTIGFDDPIIWTEVFILPGSFMSLETGDDSLIFTNILVEIEDTDEADI